MICSFDRRRKTSCANRMTNINVAAYCRVSTSHDDQLNSFASQQRYFRQYIMQHPQWQLYEIYADEGITGTSTKKRTQFNRMISDAHEGKFQLIITKEVSRFSRNILDTIAYTRSLKAHGIGVIFMSDGFSSLDPDAELRLSIMGSIAQEESRKTSTRVKWGHKRQMEKGVVFGHSLLGYIVKNGSMEIEPAGAEIVRQIFHMYGVQRKSASAIAKILCRQGIRTGTGNLLWSDTQILKILKNEKYVGDLIQKKTITPDYLTHDRKYNHGEEEQIVLRDHHQPIVSRQLWDLVQAEIIRRRRNGSTTQGHGSRYLFSGKIICGECGYRFIARTKKHSDGTVYRRWGCRNAMRYGAEKHGGLGCDVGKLIPDHLAQELLIHVLQSLPVDRHQIAQETVQSIPIIHSDHYRNTKKPERIRNKLQAAVEAYLSDTISKEELEAIKLQCRSDIPPNGTDNEAQYPQIAGLILSGDRISEIFLKTILDSITVWKDGRVVVRLRELPTQWCFQLYLS